MSRWDPNHPSSQPNMIVDVEARKRAREAEMKAQQPRPVYATKDKRTVEQLLEVIQENDLQLSESAKEALLELALRAHGNISGGVVTAPRPPRQVGGISALQGQILLNQENKAMADAQARANRVVKSGESFDIAEAELGDSPKPLRFE